MISDSSMVEASISQYLETKRDPSFESVLAMSDWCDLFQWTAITQRNHISGLRTFPMLVSLVSTLYLIARKRFSISASLKPMFRTVWEDISVM
jgi:hypothetical protein